MLPRLHRAARKGNMEELRQALQQGFPVDAMDADGQLRTALSHASELGQIEAARFLLDAGADVNMQSPSDGSSALSWAAFKGRDEMVHFLLDRGADPHVRDDEGATILVDAAAGGDSPAFQDIARTLLRRCGIDANDMDGLQRTALHSAAHFGSYNVAKILLLEGGAEDEVRDAYGETPLDLAKAAKKKRCVKLLKWYRDEMRRVEVLIKARRVADDFEALRQIQVSQGGMGLAEAYVVWGARTPLHLCERAAQGEAPPQLECHTEEAGVEVAVLRHVLMAMKEDPFDLLVGLMKYR